MAEVTVKRLDHLGLIAGVIKDLRIIELIDQHIVPDDQEQITTDELNDWFAHPSPPCVVGTAKADAAYLRLQFLDPVRRLLEL